MSSSPSLQMPILFCCFYCFQFWFGMSSYLLLLFVIRLIFLSSTSSSSTFSFSSFSLSSLFIAFYSLFISVLLSYFVPSFHSLPPCLSPSPPSMSPPDKQSLCGFIIVFMEENSEYIEPSILHTLKRLKLCLIVFANGRKDTHVSVYATLMRGEYDNKLQNMITNFSEHLASYPGQVGGGKSGLYPLFAHARTSPIMDKLHVVVMRRNNQTRYTACSVAAVFTRRWLPLSETQGVTRQGLRYNHRRFYRPCACS